MTIASAVKEVRQMDRMAEKLAAFTTVVLQQASKQKEEILRNAEAARREFVDTSELRFLQEAHDLIQDSLRKMGKASNEEISRTIVESKQALFTRREEIIDGVMQNIRKRLADFRSGEGYREFLKNKIVSGLDELGDGEIQLLVDEEDTALTRSIVADMKKAITVLVADDILSGGCLFINKSTGRMLDFSLERSIQVERQKFLTHYDLSIEG